MSKKWRIACAITGIVGVFLLAACDNFLNWVEPKDKIAIAEGYIADLQNGNLAAIRNNFDPKYLGDTLDAGMKAAASEMPRDKPKSIQIVGANVFQTTGVTTYNFTFEYEFPDRWILANVVLNVQAGKTVLEGLHIQRLRDSLEHINAFRLSGKPIASYAILAIAACIALFSIVTAVVALFSYIPSRKWLWIIFIVVGFGSLSLNWTTGAVSYSPLTVLLFGASALQQSFGPWVISFGIPLGAVMFWTRRGRWKAERSADDLRAKS